MVQLFLFTDGASVHEAIKLSVSFSSAVFHTFILFIANCV